MIHPTSFLSRWRAVALSFLLALVTAMALLLISETSYRRSVAAINDATQVFDVRLDVRRLLRLMVDAETGQRGYLLTGREEYLAPYNQAVKEIGEVLRRLTPYYAGQSQQVHDFEAMARAIERKLSEIDTTLKLRREGKDSAWQGLIDTDIGKDAQDTIRRSADKLEQAELQRLNMHQNQINQTLLIARLGVATMTVLSVLAFYFYLKQTRALGEQRERQREQLQAERDLLETEVERRTEDLTVLARHLQHAQESERSHLARELHDELGALLTSAKLDVARLQSRLPSAAPEVAERLRHLNAALNDGIALKRRIIEDLRPSALSHLGLTVSLDILTREFGQRSGLAVHTAFDPVQLDESGELTVYRFVQEALTNIAKYAKASRVDVGLHAADDGVEVTVQDDGAGFDPAQVRRSAHGLSGMRFRVEAEGGRMQLKAQPGQGTRLAAWLPLATAADAESAVDGTA